MNGHGLVWRILIFATLVLSLASRAAGDESDALEVDTLLGRLVGTEINNEVTNKTFYGFFNIPYAQKPVGERRFKDPEEPLPWEGVRDATEEGNSCVTFNVIFQSVEGDEDCLVLNVYTPKLPSELRESPLPVMVWIHGGGFHMGSGSPLFYGPEFLMTQDIVLVTINYRLNVFGFLSLQNEEVPGNAGLKDQVMALKWVKANIRSFGGDPDSITIFGESAGGASVHYHMLSPSSKGLFHRAILQSGTALNPWSSTSITAETASKLAKVFDCVTDDPSVLIGCLQEVSPEDLARHQYNVVSPKVVCNLEKRFTPVENICRYCTKNEPLKLNVFLPCVEPKESKNPFLKAKPRQLLRDGLYTDIPFMIGNVEMETLFMNKVLTDGTVPEKLLDSIYTEVNKNPSLILGLKANDIPPAQRRKVGHEVKNFYFKDLPISNETMINIINVTTDLNFLLGTNDVISYHLIHGSSPVYQYHFTLDTEFGRAKKFLGNSIKGPSHADDLGYLFLMQIAPPDLNPDSLGFKSMLKIVKLWTNFARFGNPTPATEFGVIWKPVTSEGKFYLDIGEEFVMKEDVEKERMEFWHNLRLREELLDF